MTALQDQESRDLIETELAKTLFVEAGAGSGKSTALVGRVKSLVLSGVSLSNIAAITFTEKAAAELREKLRSEMQAAAADPELAESREVLSQAAADVDLAAISTLHSFAQRLLSENPIEAGLPPGIEVLDEIGSDIEFDERWRRYLDELLENPELQDALQVLWIARVRPDALRNLAKKLDENWDLAAERVKDAGPIKPVALRALVDQFRTVADMRSKCSDPDDRLYTKLEEVAAELAMLETAESPTLAIASLEVRKYNVGRQDNWGGGDVKKAVVAAGEELTEQVKAIKRAITDSALRQVTFALTDFTLFEARRRQREGRLSFHDLLVLCRKMLRDPKSGHAVRRASRDRYTHLLLDEFQDTDPIQLELAALLGAEPAEGDHDKPWDQLTPDPGRLFFVGDPKQSIYRFRRADISLYLEAADSFGDPPVNLDTNFRSTAGILDWVNQVFGELIQPAAGSQPEYIPLRANRTDQPDGPAVTMLGRDADPSLANAYEMREQEAWLVADKIHEILSSGWEVRDEDADDGSTRPAVLGDICILLPARTSLVQLEQALENYRIPFRAESSSMLYGSEEVRDLLAAIRAIDDPTDELALVTSLRSPLFGCGDDDLFDFKVNHRGRWNHQIDLPEELPVDHPVGVAIAWFAQMYEARTWRSPSETLEATIRERGLFELAFAQSHFRDIWRRYRFVLDQARAFTDASGGSLRDYIMWVTRQAADGSRVTETVLPEHDDDAVRIMTIHASKGLEFPIGIVSGLTTRPGNRMDSVEILFPDDSDDYVVRAKAGVESRDFDEQVPIEEQMSKAEKLRLLYVACTRAMDHLVVSCVRNEDESKSGVPNKTAAGLIARAAAGVELDSTSVSASDRVYEPLVVMPKDRMPRDEWLAEKERRLASAGRNRITSPSAVAQVGYEIAREADDGTKKEGRDLDLPAWQRGRYGSAVGRAVHGTLQVIDLANPTDVSAVAAAQAASEGVDAQTSDVEALTLSALASSTVEVAGANKHWKEVFVAAPVGEKILEGYIDLVYEDGDQLVVVDYKTDYVPNDDALADKLERYRLQLASYAIALEGATGRTVSKGVFVFCDPDGARTVEIEDLTKDVAAASQVIADI